MKSWRHKLLAAAALVLAAVLLAGLWKLLRLRFASGDLHPPHSSLQAGPKGTKAIFEALGALGRPQVERNYIPLERLRPRRGTTLLFAGAGESFFGTDAERRLERLERLMEEGMDVVALLGPEEVPVWTDSETGRLLRDPWRPWDERPEDADTPETPHRARRDAESAAERWGFRFLRTVERSKEPAEGFSLSAPGAEVPLPRWRTGWRLQPRDEAWEVLARVDQRPVLLRRRFGRGTLTLGSDVTFFTNEALREQARPGFILWLLGERPRLLFDETHHGTSSSPGTMYLVRHYRLGGFFIGLAVVLALFLWRSSSSLIPPPPEPEEQEAASLARSSAGALRQLIQQHIPLSSLQETLAAEWERNPFLKRRHGGRRRAEVQSLLKDRAPAREQALLSLWRSATEALRRPD